MCTALQEILPTLSKPFFPGYCVRNSAPAAERGFSSSYSYFYSSFSSFSSSSSFSPSFSFSSLSFSSTSTSSSSSFSLPLLLYFYFLFFIFFLFFFLIFFFSSLLNISNYIALSVSPGPVSSARSDVGTTERNEYQVHIYIYIPGPLAK
jgi:hypothetical protein